MGLPTINSANMDPFILSLDIENTPRRNSQLDRKRTHYSHYHKKNGELICGRKFCKTCLKQNYDFNNGEIITKIDWVCPFCLGTCYCTRCLRNDMITRLKGVFIILGGDLVDISRESLYDTFLIPK